ncbi:MAG: hypothetical protein ACREDD_08630 [Methylocella sp.]
MFPGLSQTAPDRREKLAATVLLVGNGAFAGQRVSGTPQKMCAPLPRDNEIAGLPGTGA